MVDFNQISRFSFFQNVTLLTNLLTINLCLELESIKHKTNLNYINIYTQLVSFKPPPTAHHPRIEAAPLDAHDHRPPAYPRYASLPFWYHSASWQSD